VVTKRVVKESPWNMDGVAIPRVKKFGYLGWIIEEKGDIDEDISQRIIVEWQKWKNTSNVLCDKKILVGLKQRVYRMVVRPTMLYSSKCWPIKKTQVQIVMTAEMRMIWWICSYTKLDKIRNEMITEKMGMTPIEDKTRETRLWWSGHVKRMSENVPVGKCETTNLS